MEASTKLGETSMVLAIEASSTSFQLPRKPSRKLPQASITNFWKLPSLELEWKRQRDSCVFHWLPQTFTSELPPTSICSYLHELLPTSLGMWRTLQNSELLPVSSTYAKNDNFPEFEFGHATRGSRWKLALLALKVVETSVEEFHGSSGIFHELLNCIATRLLLIYI